MSKPLDTLIDSTMRCTICDAPMGGCDCWGKCSCGWSARKGEPCRNPSTSRCSSKMKYNQPHTCAIVAVVREIRHPEVTLILAHACGAIERRIARSWCETKERPAPKRVKCYNAIK